MTLVIVYVYYTSKIQNTLLHKTAEPKILSRTYMSIQESIRQKSSRQSTEACLHHWKKDLVKNLIKEK